MTSVVFDWRADPTFPLCWIQYILYVLQEKEREKQSGRILKGFTWPAAIIQVNYFE